MKPVPPENKKYVTKFGMHKTSSTDWHQESKKALARCTWCVKRYGDAPKHDHLTLEFVNGVGYLCCSEHRRKKNGQTN